MSIRMNNALKEITALSNSSPTAPYASYLDMSADEAKVVCVALSKLTPPNKADLLSQPENVMVFLSRAVVNQPCTAYEVIKAALKTIVGPSALEIKGEIVAGDVKPNPAESKPFVKAKKKTPRISAKLAAAKANKVTASKANSKKAKAKKGKKK